MRTFALAMTCALAPCLSIYSEDRRDASPSCTSAGPHECQVLVHSDTMMSRQSGWDCGDRSIIDILWVYTPEALAYWGSEEEVSSKCEEAVADANLTFANSELPFSVRTVGIHGTDYVEMEGYLGHVKDPSDGYMDEVHPLRDELAADIVVLITVEMLVFQAAFS